MMKKDVGVLRWDESSSSLNCTKQEKKTINVVWNQNVHEQATSKFTFIKHTSWPRLGEET